MPSKVRCQQSWCWVVSLQRGPSLADVKEKVAALSSSGLVLVLDANKNELVAQNVDEPFVPASVTKIVTAWLALEALGDDYRFETRFYLDKERVLYVRGGLAASFPVRVGSIHADT